MKKDRNPAGLALAGLALAGMLGLAGCSPNGPGPIKSQEDATRAAQAVGVGSNSGYAKGASSPSSKAMAAAVKLVDDSRSSASSTARINAAVTVSDGNGGSLTLTPAASASGFATTEQESQAQGTAFAFITFAYKNWHSQDKDGNSYILNGTAYGRAYAYANTSPITAGIQFLITSTNLSIDGESLKASFACDYSFIAAASLSSLYYTSKGKVGGFSVDNSFSATLK